MSKGVFEDIYNTYKKYIFINNYIKMKSNEDVTAIINILSYITLLPYTEVCSEVSKVAMHIKNINNDKRFSSNYKKILKKLNIS